MCVCVCVCKTLGVILSLSVNQIIHDFYILLLELVCFHLEITAKILPLNII